MIRRSKAFIQNTLNGRVYEALGRVRPCLRRTAAMRAGQSQVEPGDAFLSKLAFHSFYGGLPFVENMHAARLQTRVR